MWVMRAESLLCYMMLAGIRRTSAKWFGDDDEYTIRPRRRNRGSANWPWSARPRPQHSGDERSIDIISIRAYIDHISVYSVSARNMPSNGYRHQNGLLHATSNGHLSEYIYYLYIFQCMNDLKNTLYSIVKHMLRSETSCQHSLRCIAEFTCALSCKHIEPIEVTRIDSRRTYGLFA